MTQASSCPSRDRLEQLSSGTLPAPVAAALREHLMHCAECARVLESLHASTLSVPVQVIKHAEAAGADQTPHPTSPTLALEAFTYLLPPEQAGEIGRLGPYRILKVLGEGGMGVVFQARDPLLDRLVALKVMKPDGATAVSRQRFLHEGKVAAQLQHDHIVTIYQVGEDRGVPYLAMQFLEGEPLDRRLKRDGRLPIREVLRIGREVAEGLAAAHARGLIHRDIKPANIWLETHRSGAARVKILDFGLARAVNDNATHLTRTGVIMGTPDYMAPEQARGQGLDPRCDIFSLGCVMYHMATGRKPFQGEDVMATLLALATEEPLPMQQHNPEVPWELEERIKAMMAKNPGDRLASAAAVVEELTYLEENLDNLSKTRAAAPRPAAPPPAPGGMPRAPVRKTPRRTVNPAASVDELLRGPVPADSKRRPVAAPPPEPKPVESHSRTAPLLEHGLSAWSGEQAPVAPPAPPAVEDRTAPLSKSKVLPPAPPASAPPPAAKALAEPAPGKSEACPRCGSRRYTSGPMGWCLACGYAPGTALKVEPEADKLLEKRRQEESLAWLTVLLIGALGIVIATFIVDQLIRPGAPDWKTWVWFQMTAGLGSFMLAILWCYALIREYNDDQSFLPIFFKPIYFLRLTWQLHYRTRQPICLGAWGLVMAVAIAVVVGDPYYWINGGKMRMRVPTYKLGMASAGPRQDSVKNGTFVVIGFRLEEDDQISSVLLAEERGGRLVYVGSAERVASTASSEGVARNLILLLRGASPVPGLDIANVRWVEPKMTCSVDFTGRRENGTLVEPLILSWEKK